MSHPHLLTAVLPIVFALLVACGGSSSQAAPTPQPFPGVPVVEGIYELVLAPGQCQGLPTGLTAAITSAVMLSAAGAGWTGIEAEEKHGRFELRIGLAPQGAAYVTGTLTGTILNQFSGTGPGFLRSATIAGDRAAQLSGVRIPEPPATLIAGDVEGAITVADSVTTYSCSRLSFILSSR
jgi:hypothetical protein